MSTAAPGHARLPPQPSKNSRPAPAPSETCNPVMMGLASTTGDSSPVAGSTSVRFFVEGAHNEALNRHDIVSELAGALVITGDADVCREKHIPGPLQ